MAWPAVAVRQALPFFASWRPCVRRRGRCSSALPFFAFFASFAVQTVVRAAEAAPVLRWRDTGGGPDLDETLYYCNDANMNLAAARAGHWETGR